MLCLMYGSVDNTPVLSGSWPFLVNGSLSVSLSGLTSFLCALTKTIHLKLSFFPASLQIFLSLISERAFCKLGGVCTFVCSYYMKKQRLATFGKKKNVYVQYTYHLLSFWFLLILFLGVCFTSKFKVAWIYVTLKFSNALTQSLESWDYRLLYATTRSLIIF